MDGDRFEAHVERKAVTSENLTALLNERWRDGWRLVYGFPASRGGTVFVFERVD